MVTVPMSTCLIIGFGFLIKISAGQTEKYQRNSTDSPKDAVRKAERVDICFSYLQGSSVDIPSKATTRLMRVRVNNVEFTSFGVFTVTTFIPPQAQMLLPFVPFGRINTGESVHFWEGDVVTDVIKLQVSIEERMGHFGLRLCMKMACRQGVTQTKVGEILWPETDLLSKASVACSANTVDGPSAPRMCAINDSTRVAEWAGPNVDACNVTRKLAELNNTVFTSGNVSSVLNQLEKMTANGSELASSDVTLVMNTVARALDSSDIMGDVVALEETVNVLSNLVNTAQRFPEEDVADSLLAATHKISTQGKLSNGQLMLSSDNLVVAAQEISSDNVQGLALIIQTKGNDSSFQDGDVTIQDNASSPPADDNSLFLPRSLMSPGVRVAMIVHKDGRVFEAKKQPKEESHYKTKVNSYVIAAVVVGINVSDLEDPIIYSLVHQDQNSGNPLCVYWDETTNDWSTQGCSEVVERRSERVTTCQCDHLTNFALLMDVYQHGHSLSETHVKALSFISYIGCGVSLVALLLTILTYSLFNPMSSKSSTDSGSDKSKRRNLRRDIPSQILLNLCTALALSNLVFVVGMHPYATGTAAGCKVVAVLLHFSLLSSMCWMLVEAFNLFLNIVIVFKPHFAKFILKCSLVGWGIPLLVVAVTLGVNKTENYGSSNTGMCWLKGIAFYVAFVGPVALILLVNVATFIMIMYRISGVKGVQHSDSTSSSVQKRLRAVVGVTVLLGLTWVFGFLAVSRDSAVVFYYLFALFNCLQGLWIFLFYCIIRKEARAVWLWALPCFGAQQDSKTTNRGPNRKHPSAPVHYNTRGEVTFSPPSEQAP